MHPHDGPPVPTDAAAGPGAAEARLRIQVGDRLTAEQLYRLLSDNPSDVVYCTGPDRRAVWISDSISLYTDWTPEDLVGTVIDELVHPEDWHASQPVREALRAGAVVPTAGAGLEPPMRIRLSDGSYRWMSVIGVPLLDADGSPIGIVGRLRDVDELVNAMRRAEAGEARLSATLDSQLDPHLLLAPVHAGGRVADFECVDANPAAARYLRRDRADLVGTRLTGFASPDTAPELLATLADTYRSGQSLVLDDLAFPSGSEQPRYYDVRVVRVNDWLACTWRDRTNRHLTEQRVAESEELYRLVTEDVTDAVVRCDDAGVVTWVSPSFERLTGFPSDSVVGTSGRGLVAPEQAGSLAALLADRGSASDLAETLLRIRRDDGSTRWVAARVRPFVRGDGHADGSVTVLRDVQEHVEAQDRLEQEMGHDPLTGLANRELAAARIQRALSDLTGPTEVALLCVGVDRLSTVNQALTYSGGDLVLATVARRITGCVGNPDLVARATGDEFLVLLPSLASGADAATMAERVRAAARGEVRVGVHVIEPTVSIGIATGNRSTDAEELLRQAGLALQQAKAAGRDRWQFVDPDVATEAQHRLSVEARLRDALRDGLVVPWFQPVVTLADRRVRGYEALARWLEQDGTVVPPGDFLPVAERSALIVDVDLAILRQAIDLLRVSPVEHVSINVSAPSLVSADYPGRLDRLIRTAAVDPARIRLELIETSLLSGTTGVGEVMRSVAEIGPTWYVDDFGTGYSSISHLRDLPVRGLKLDRSFSAGIRHGDARSLHLATGLVGLAEGLGLDTVAEGIESEFEAGLLLGQGWQQGQGWLFGRPEPVPAVPPT